MPAEESPYVETNLAVLIDFENIAAGTEKEGLGRFDVNSLMQRVKDKGRILVARSYADWGRFSRFKQTLLTNNVTMMELTSHGMQDKNRADIAMVVDALELAFTRDYINTFVVVSGDSDFTPMVLKMRELDKRVIGIGTRKSTSRLLINACDEFIFYDSIVQPQQKPSRRKAPKGGGGRRNDLDKAYDLLETALAGLQREMPDQPLASVVKSAMKRKSPDFNESDLGFNSFGRFLESAQDAGVIALSRDRKSGGYRVMPVDEEGKGVLEVGGPDIRETDSDWEDEYLPEAAGPLVTALTAQELPVLAAPTRLAVLEALESVVAERKRRRRKTTIQFVRDDLRKKLRNTHPNIPGPLLRGVLDGLLQCGELIHRDGTAIRSASAAFVLTKDAAELNVSLTRLYLSTLLETGADVTDTALLAELFLGHRDQQREIETTLAWLQTAEAENGDESSGHGAPAPSEDLNDLDLDDLLVMGDDDGRSGGTALEVIEAEATPEPKKKKKTTTTRTRKKKPVVEDKTNGVTAEAAEEPKPKRTRKKNVETTEASAEAEAETKPKPKRTRKKKVEPVETESPVEALLDPQPGPEVLHD